MAIEFTYLKCPPRKYTFEMGKLKAWTIRNSSGKVLNLFAGQTLLKPLDEVRIDLNKDMPAHYYMDAFAFVLMAKEQGMMFDTVIFDPPYNLRKSREKYFGVYTSELRKIKTELPNIIREGGKVLCYGYDTTGMGRQRGFELIGVCVVNHSGDHNDTLCTVERKIQSSLFGGEEKFLEKTETEIQLEPQNQAFHKAPVMRSVCSYCNFPKIIWTNSAQKYLCGKCGKEQTDV